MTWNITDMYQLQLDLQLHKITPTGNCSQANYNHNYQTKQAKIRVLHLC